MRQKRALYLAASGQCEGCGTHLQGSWHADHVIPYSMGGSTSISNGQALCPRCNLQKSDNVMHDTFNTEHFGPCPHPSPLKWQKEALQEFKQVGNNFLADATPGCGKTAFAAYLFRQFFGETWEQIIIVTNGKPRQEGWIEDLGAFGINLMPNWAGRYSKPTMKGYHGSVITYAIMPGNEMQLQALCQKPTLVVFDEIHHLGDSMSWGDAARAAFNQRSVQTVGLTGTPFRSDGNPIPFVDYQRDEDGKMRSVGHVGYSYGDALKDGVLRYVNLPTYGGEIEWEDNDGHHKADLEEEISEHLQGNRLRAAILQKKWLLPSIKSADERLSQTRGTTAPSAAGLIVAKDQRHAQEIASWMRKDPQFNEDPAVIVSDGDNATSSIKAFREGSKRWVIAVKMISEGVNIPRLRVGVYASNVTAPLFLNQVVGRVLRGSDGYAWFWFPADPRITEVLEEIREMRDHVIEAEEDIEPTNDGGPVGELPFFDAIDAQPQQSRTYGPLFDEIKYMDEEQVAELPGEILAAYIKTHGRLPQSTPKQEGIGKTKWAEEQELRKTCQRKVVRVAKIKHRELYICGGSSKGKAIAKTHAWANKRAHITSTDTATTKQLRDKAGVLQSYIDTHS